MKKPKALIFSGFGLNCEEETKYAFELAGGEADIVHITDLVNRQSLLKKYQILAFPGGFSYGDDTGAGNAFANKVRNHLWDTLQNFIAEDHLIIGICNGFQILTNLGLLPALQDTYGDALTTLVSNISARYSVRYVDIKITSSTPWLKDIDTFSCPIAHGEGNFYTSRVHLTELKKKKLIAAKYFTGETCTYLSQEANPNGSLDDIAAITDESKRVLGMMPHPERALFFTQLPNWQVLKIQLQKEKKPLPESGPGLKIFKNAVDYFS